MNCRHERIKCVNCVKYCMDCGIRLADCVQPLKPDNVQKDTPEETPKKATRKKRGEAK